MVLCGVDIGVLTDVPVDLAVTLVLLVHAGKQVLLMLLLLEACRHSWWLQQHPKLGELHPAL